MLLPYIQKLFLTRSWHSIRRLLALNLAAAPALSAFGFVQTIYKISPLWKKTSFTQTTREKKEAEPVHKACAGMAAWKGKPIFHWKALPVGLLVAQFMRYQEKGEPRGNRTLQQPEVWRWRLRDDARKVCIFCGFATASWPSWLTTCCGWGDPTREGINSNPRAHSNHASYLWPENPAEQ